jgi:hypothetical protein
MVVVVKVVSENGVVIKEESVSLRRGEQRTVHLVGAPDCGGFIEDGMSYVGLKITPLGFPLKKFPSFEG